MTNKLKVWPNQRVDLGDFDRASHEYAQDLTSEFHDKYLLDRKSQVFSGFRVRVDEAPGQVTVYSGAALDRSGKLVTDPATDSVTITLPGASTTFYLEVEYFENDTATDGRAFWDPSLVNAPPIPNGREVGLTVASRTASTWRVVQPVSTTGFQSTTNPNSVRIPIGIYATNGVGEITNVSSPGLVQVFPSTVTLSDILIGDDTVSVADASLFRIGDTITLNFGDGTAEAGLTVTLVEPSNGVIHFNPVTGNAHLAGAIIRRTNGVGRLVRERSNPISTSEPDRTQRFWQGNERRGSALVQSKETFGARDDLNLSTLKDAWDTTTALMREMKFGSMRPEITSAAPPSTFPAQPRYVDTAGSITGARSNTVSIGDGVNSFGDFNGTSHTVFVNALASLPALGGHIYVKPGTYTFTTTVAVSREVIIEGGGRDTTQIVSNVAGAPAFTFDLTASTDVLSLRNLSFTVGTGLPTILTGQAGHLDIQDCNVNGNIKLLSGGPANSLTASRSRLESPSVLFGDPTLSEYNTTRLQNSSISDCYIQCGSVVFATLLQNVQVNNCVVVASIGFMCSNDTFRVAVTGCQFFVNTLVNQPWFGPVFSGFSITSSHIDIVPGASLSSILVVAGGSTVADFKMVGCNVQAAYAFASTTFANPGRLFNVDTTSTISNLAVSNCSFSMLSSGEYVEGIRAQGVLLGCNINNCSFTNFSSLYKQVSGSATDCTFSGNTFRTPATLPYISPTVTDVSVIDITGAQVTRCTFSSNNITTTVSVPTAIGYTGITIDTGVLNLLGCVISDNNIRISSGSNRPLLSGVFVNSTGNGSCNITGNTVDILEANAFSVLGIFYSGGTGIACVIANNTIRNVHAFGNAAGIRGSHCSIVGNFVNSVFATNAGASDSYGIRVATMATVTGNHIRGVRGVTAVDTIASIQIEGESTVSSNKIECSPSGPSTIGIMCTTYQPVTVTDNHIIMGLQATHGIYFRTSEVASGWTINNNTINLMSRTSTCYGIRVLANGVAANNVSVCGNNVAETVFHANHLGILLQGDLGGTINNCNISNNTVRGVNPPNDRSVGAAGIYLIWCTESVVNSNTVRWSFGAFGANSIFFSVCNTFVANSNRVTPCSSGARNEIVVDAGSSNGLINANYVGNGASGVISNAGTNVTSTNNKLT